MVFLILIIAGIFIWLDSLESNSTRPPRPPAAVAPVAPDELERERAVHEHLGRRNRQEARAAEGCYMCKLACVSLP